MLPATTMNTTSTTRRKRTNGSYHATRLIFSKLWRSRVKLPESIIVGKDGSIEQWLFFSKASRCLMRKSHETLNNGNGHDLLLEKFLPSSSTTTSSPAIHVLAPGGRAVFDHNGLQACMSDLKKQHNILIAGLNSGGKTIVRTSESVHEQDISNHSIGAFVATKYIQPADHSVIVVEIIRNPQRPKNMVREEEEKKKDMWPHIK